MSEVKRDAKGRVLPGSANLKTKTQHTRAKAVSIKVKRELVKRYGETEGRIAMYITAMDIMRDPTNDPNARLKAAEFLANRVDGKAVDHIVLTGQDGGPVQVESLSNDELTPSQRLALALKSLGILAQHGGLTAGGQVDGVGRVLAGGVAGLLAGGDGGEPTTQ